MNWRFILEKIIVHPLNMIPSEIGVIIRRIVYKFMFKEMGKKVSIKNSIVIKHLYNIEVGDNTNINQFCFINGMGGIKIGKYCEIAPMVSLVSFNYNKDKLPTSYQIQGKEEKPIIIGDNVWLGSKATVVAGVSIGNNTIVGSNSVVTKDLPANCIAVGSPARIVKVFKNGKWVKHKKMP